MHRMLEDLREKDLIQKNETCLFDHTDGCNSQYQNCTVLYLLTILSVQFKVTIDRFVHCPVHGKETVDGRNTVNKRFLLDCMRRSGKVDSEDFTD